MVAHLKQNCCWSCITFCNILVFHDEEVLDHYLTYKLEDHLFLAMQNCLFNITIDYKIQTVQYFFSTSSYDSYFLGETFSNCLIFGEPDYVTLPFRITVVDCVSDV
jgi:hypothetical protein